MREICLSGSMSGDRKQDQAKPDCGGAAKASSNNHRETTVTAPVLDSTRLSDNVVPVKYFLSALTRALRRARHFALVEGSAIPTKARS
jgi:hypothetical protein